MTLTLVPGGEECAIDMEELFLEMMERNPKVSLSAMSDELRIDRNGASRTVKKMKDAGLVERIGGPGDIGG